MKALYNTVTRDVFFRKFKQCNRDSKHFGKVIIFFHKCYNRMANDSLR